MSQQKSGWGPVTSFLAVALPLAGAAGGIFSIHHARSEPEPAPAAVVAPPPPIEFVMPAPPPEPPKIATAIDIKSTGKSRVSTVGPAPEPPPFVTIDKTAGGYSPPRGSPAIYGGPRRSTVVRDSSGTPIASAAPAPVTQQPAGGDSGLTYRDAVSNSRDPLLPFGPKSSEGTTSYPDRRYQKR